MRRLTCSVTPKETLSTEACELWKQTQTSVGRLEPRRKEGEGALTVDANRLDLSAHHPERGGRRRARTAREGGKIGRGRARSLFNASRCCR